MKKTIFLALAMLLAAATGFAAGTENADSIAIADSIARVEQMNEQIRSIVSEEVSNAIQSIQNNGGNAGGFAAIIFDGIENVLIPVVAIACPFIMVCVIIYVIASNATKRRQRKYDMVEKAIESGVEIPEYVFREAPEKDDEKPAKSALNSAVILIAVGIAVTLFFTIKENYDVAALSSVILLLGIGKLIVYILDARSEKKLQESKNGGKAEERQDA